MLPGLNGLAMIGAIRAAGYRDAGARSCPRSPASTTGSTACAPGPTIISASPFRSPNCPRGSRRCCVASDRVAVETQQTRLTVGDLEIDLLGRTVMREGRSIALGAREFNLLEYLARHAGQVVTRTMMLEKIWNYHFDPGSNVVDVHIGRLRRKIEEGFAAPILHTVRGAGYRLSRRGLNAADAPVGHGADRAAGDRAGARVEPRARRLRLAADP